MPVYLDEAKRRVPIVLSDLLEMSVDNAYELETSRCVEGPDFIIRIGGWQFELAIKSTGEITQVSKAISQIKRLELELVDDKAIFLLVVPFMSQAGVGLRRGSLVLFLMPLAQLIPSLQSDRVLRTFYSGIQAMGSYKNNLLRWQISARDIQVRSSPCIWISDISGKQKTIEFASVSLV